MKKKMRRYKLDEAELDKMREKFGRGAVAQAVGILFDRDEKVTGNPLAYVYKVAQKITKGKKYRRSHGSSTFRDTAVRSHTKKSKYKRKK